MNVDEATIKVRVGESSIFVKGVLLAVYYAKKYDGYFNLTHHRNIPKHQILTRGNSL